MTGTYAALVIEAPGSGVGILTGWGNWRFVIQAAVPNSAYGRFDVDTFGHANFSDGYMWTDVSSRWRGAEWTRGSEGLQDRPGTGEATLTLDNNDGALSRWNGNSTFPSAPTYLGPDLLVRLGWRDQVAGVWEPAFTGLVDEAEDDQAEGDADRWMTWALVETTSLLAIIDRAEQPSSGTGDDSFDRIDRLLADAGWEFGLGDNFGGGFINPELQPTTMAGNRLGEVYLTADSGFLDAFSDRSGRLDTWAKGFTSPLTLADGTTLVGVSESLFTTTIGAVAARFLPWVRAPKILDTKVGMFNRVAVGRVGGIQLGAEDSASVGLNGPVDYSRTDLLMVDDADLETWAGYFLLFFANSTLRMDGLELMPELDTTRGLEVLTRLDIGRSLYAFRSSPRQAAWEDVTFVLGVTGYTCSASPASPGRAVVTATLNVNVSSHT